MANLYLYAIVDRAGAGLGALTGHSHDPLTILGDSGPLAVVSLAGPTPLALTREHLLRHEALVEALMEGRAVLPARFGTTVSLPVLFEALGRHAAALAQSLDRVRGRVELALRVIDPAASEAPAPRPSRATARGGRDYLLALLEAERRQARLREDADSASARIAAALAPLAESVVHSGPSGRQLLKAAYLVRRERLEALREAINGQRAANPRLAFLATGPWPTYSFAGLDQSLSPMRAEGAI